MIVFADLHLREDTEGVVFSEVLPALHREALADPDRQLVCLGDFWHLRYLVPVYLQNRVYRFFEALGRDGVRLTLLPGNHDQIDPSGNNALEVFGSNWNVTVYHEPIWTAQGLWVPYRKDRAAFRAALALPRPQGAPAVLWTHHGVQGARMSAEQIDTDGVPVAELVVFPLVLTGHYHMAQTVGPVTYIGSPYQVKADEAGQRKGFMRYRSGGSREFVELIAGKRYHLLRATRPEELDLSGVRPGDEVRLQLPAGAVGAAFAKAIEARGASALLSSDTEEHGARLSVSATAGLDEYAQAYVAEFAAGLDPARLMDVYRRVVHGN